MDQGLWTLEYKFCFQKQNDYLHLTKFQPKNLQLQQYKLQNLSICAIFGNFRKFSPKVNFPENLQPYTQLIKPEYPSTCLVERCSGQGPGAQLSAGYTAPPHPTPSPIFSAPAATLFLHRAAYFDITGAPLFQRYALRTSAEMEMGQWVMGHYN